MKKKSIKRLIKSFKYALEGIIYAFKNEQNIIVHTIVTMLVIIFGIIFKISIFEWIICVALIGIVISAELINTSIEAIVDLNCQEIKPLAKIAKDTSSGAVLILAITSAIIGCIIFIPKIFI